MPILNGCRTYVIGKKAFHFSCHSTIKKRPEGRFFIRGHFAFYCEMGLFHFNRSRTSRNQKGLSFRPKGEILAFLPWSRKSRFLSAFGMTSFYILLKEHILQYIVFA